MGFAAVVLNPLRGLLWNKSTGFILAAAIFSFVVVAVIVNVFNQLFRKNPNEPPVVFHWIPFFGSTITYGIDPYKFFFACRERVRCSTAFPR